MDSCQAALPFVSKAFNTSRVTERLVLRISIHIAGLGQDGFWQKNITP